MYSIIAHRSVRLLVLTLFHLSLAGGQTDTRVKSFRTPPAEGGNDFYLGNRAPLLTSPLIKLPVGAIKPDGWLRSQLELMAEGFTGHLTEISKWCKFEGNAWADHTGERQYGWKNFPIG